jgi:hypothetical protein
LESVQIEAGRIITGLQCNSSRQKLYHELEWETLENRRNKHKLILCYKILNTPAYLYELVQPYLPRQSGLTEEMKIIHSIHHFPEQVLFMIVFSLSPYKTMEYFAPNYY